MRAQVAGLNEDQYSLGSYLTEFFKLTRLEIVSDLIGFSKLWLICCKLRSKQPLSVEFVNVIFVKSDNTMIGEANKLQCVRI